MRLLDQWNVRTESVVRTIELLEGDLSQLSSQDGVDILVVSAFPNDYTATRGSLIGALYRRRLSIATLAESKLADLRQDFSCWLSRTVHFDGRPAHVLCVESGWRGTPPEIADDLFRALATASVVDVEKSVVAMPVIGAGDQGYPMGSVMEAILNSALSWLRRGLPVQRLKIVVRPASAAEALKEFVSIREKTDRSREASAQSYDVFLSYAHVDEAFAKLALDAIRGAQPHWRVFFDRTTLAPGMSWLMEIAESLDNSRRVLALYTPEYWKSRFCRDEFLAAFTRQQDSGAEILSPVYLRTTQIPYLFRTVQYAECREADTNKLTAACEAFCRVGD
jgi:O-acetyl-ADP-ribose deacetylase (regulator of RNase III)